MNDKLSDAFVAHIRFLRQHYPAAVIRKSFDDAYNQCCPSLRASSDPISLPTPAPIVCTQTAREMEAAMHDFCLAHGSDLSASEGEWFDRIAAVVEAGRKLTGRQVTTINSIAERHAGERIIF